MVESTPSETSSTSSSSSSRIDRQQQRHLNRKATTATRRRPESCPVDESGELVECSGKYCSSCTATIVADCIAVCCCPCAIANLVILTFVKVPWMMGRRCLRYMKKKRRMLVRKKRKEKSKNEGVTVNVNVNVNVMERNGDLRRKEARVILERDRYLSGCEDVEESENFCASYEAERVWLELYQLGHLGFGRVSFSGVGVPRED